MPPETVTDALSGTAIHQPRMDGAWRPLGLAARGAMDPARDKLHAALSASKEVQSTEYGGNHVPGILPPHSQALPDPLCSSPLHQNFPDLTSAQGSERGVRGGAEVTDKDVGTHGI